MADPVIDALDALLEVLAENARVDAEIARRAGVIREQRERGSSYRDIVSTADGSLVVELLRQNLDRLFDAGSRVRRAQARALHDEGMSTEAIAKLFGVSRQRISALLKERRVDAAAP